MPTTTFNYGDWSFWRPYFPPDGYYGESKVAFDGPNKLILIAEGETLISVKSQIYSVWKRWVQVPGANNARWPQAMSAVGGDPITTTEFLGATFFLENGWRIQPAPGNYILSIEGNLYTREVNGNPVNSTPGVAVSLVRANLVDGRIAITQEDYEAIADEVWDELRYEHTGDGSFGQGMASVRGDIIGNISGDLEGNVEGSVLTDIYGNLRGDVLGPTNLVNSIWDEPLNSVTHNVTDSAGKRIWTQQNYGGYQAGSVWINTFNGTSGIVTDTNGTVGLPSSNINDAYTIAQNNRIYNFFINAGSNINFTGFSSNISNYRFWGEKWNLNLGGKNISGVVFEGCVATGIGTISTASSIFRKVVLDNAQIGPSEFHGCYFVDNFTVDSAGDYIFDQCFSASAGETAINFDMGAAVGVTRITFTHWSGNIQINNMSTGDIVTIEGTGNVIIDASCNAGDISIRGTISVTDNSAGAVTVTSDAVIDQQRISDAVWDQVLNAGTYNTAESAGKRLRDIQDLDLVTLQSSANKINTDTESITGTLDSYATPTIRQSLDKIDIDLVSVTAELTTDDLTTADQKLDSIISTVNIIDTNVDKVNLDVESVTGTLDSYNIIPIRTTINDISTKVDTIDTNVIGVLGDTAAIEGKIDTIDNIVDDIQLDTAAIESKVDTANTNITTTQSTVNSIDTNVISVQTTVNNIDSDITNVQGTVNTINSKVTTIDNIVDQIKQINTGRWKIDRVTSILTIYDTNGTTPLFEFNLKDDTGAANPDTVYERVPI